MAHPGTSRLKLFSPQEGSEDGMDSIVITGIGLCASIGRNREEVWQGIQEGRLGARRLTQRDQMAGLELPAAMCDWLERRPDRLPAIELGEYAAAEALHDAQLPEGLLPSDRFACSMASHFGDVTHVGNVLAGDLEATHPWWKQFFPLWGGTRIAHQFGLWGPRMCHATACASGLISVIAAVRSLRDGQCDFALAGGADAIQPILISAFHRMGVLANERDAAQACRPFDKKRKGFVMGEGAALMVLERKADAIERGARIYAEIGSMQMLSEANHVTSLDQESETLEHLIRLTARKAGWRPSEIDYVNAHGTGTEQNDRNELMGVRRALGTAADQVLMSSIKGLIGHTINAAGAIELAVTALAIRDGFAPPTMNLSDPETLGNIDCLPSIGQRHAIHRAVKLSLAFGGHLVAIGLEKSERQYSREALPLSSRALVREQRVRRAA